MTDVRIRNETQLEIDFPRLPEDAGAVAVLGRFGDVLVALHVAQGRGQQVSEWKQKRIHEFPIKRNLF